MNKKIIAIVGVIILGLVFYFSGARTDLFTGSFKKISPKALQKASKKQPEKASPSNAPAAKSSTVTIRSNSGVTFEAEAQISCQDSDVSNDKNIRGTLTFNGLFPAADGSPLPVVEAGNGPVTSEDLCAERRTTERDCNPEIFGNGPISREDLQGKLNEGKSFTADSARHECGRFECSVGRCQTQEDVDAAERAQAERERQQQEERAAEERRQAESRAAAEQQRVYSCDPTTIRYDNKQNLALSKRNLIAFGNALYWGELKRSGNLNRFVVKKQILDGNNQSQIIYNDLHYDSRSYMAKGHYLVLFEVVPIGLNVANKVIIDLNDFSNFTNVREVGPIVRAILTEDNELVWVDEQFRRGENGVSYLPLMIENLETDEVRELSTHTTSQSKFIGKASGKFIVFRANDGEGMISAIPEAGGEPIRIAANIELLPFFGPEKLNAANAFVFVNGHYVGYLMNGANGKIFRRHDLETQEVRDFGPTIQGKQFTYGIQQEPYGVAREFSSTDARENDIAIFGMTQEGDPIGIGVGDILYKIKQDQIVTILDDSFFDLQINGNDISWYSLDPTLKVCRLTPNS